MPRRVARHAVVQPLDPSVRLIPLTQGQNAIVDAVDYDWLTQWNWFAHWSKAMKGFYAGHNEGKKPNRHEGRMHRIVLGLEPDDEREADHINHNTLDNRRKNLRIVTHAENMINRRKNRNNTSGFKGVCPDGKNKWKAQISINREKIHLGAFATPEEAYAVYCEAVRNLHGRYANLK